MKFTTAVITLAAAGAVVAAQPHHHHKHHHVKRTAETEVVEGPTVYEFVLDGEKVSESKVCDGIKDGSLEWDDSTAPPGACKDNASDPPEVEEAQFFEQPEDEPNMNVVAPIVETPTTSAYVEPPAPTPTPPSTPPSTPPPTSGGTGVDSVFPDGELSCDTFPSEYGAIEVGWLGLGGWSGVQFVSIVGQMVNDIRTAITGESCGEGAMCSYACPAGYQKTQWPSTQGATGQSVGGLECRGGKLYLTNPDLSDKLCMEGAGGISVKNTMGDNVAVCRTDYPGTEAETVPLDSSAGSEQPLTCPDASSYYQWQGKDTTAQYYVNPAGVSLENGCQWGTDANPWGNYAPLNLGVGKVDGKTWLSIMQNAPTTYEKLDFNIKIEGSGLSGACKYENGMFHDLNGSNDKGCTVEAMDGQAKYVFY